MAGRWSGRKATVRVAVAMALLSWGAPAVPDIFATNGILSVEVSEGLYDDHGAFTVFTGSAHPVPNAPVLFPGYSGFFTVRDDASMTMWTNGFATDPGLAGYTCIPLSGTSATVVAIGTVGALTTFTQSGFKVEEEVVVEGATLADTRVRQTLTITNTSAVTRNFGARIMWDIDVNGSDDAWFSPRQPDGAYTDLFGSWTGVPPFAGYEIANTYPLTTLSAFGTIASAGLPIPPTPPDRFRYCSWSSAAGSAWDFTDVALGGTDSAVAYYWGWGSPIQLAPGQSVSFTQYLTTFLDALEIAAVTVVKTAPSSVPAGDTFAYSIALHNAGSDAVEPLDVWDTLPAGCQFVSASPGGSLAGGVVSWTLASLPAGGTATVWCAVRAVESVPSIGPNTASVAGIDTSGNPVPPVTSNAVHVTVLRGIPVLTLSATPSGSLCSGEHVDYAVSWRNAGSVTIWGLTLTDTLPAGTSWTGPAGFWAQPDGLGTPALLASAWAPGSPGPWIAGEPPAGTEPATVRWVVDRVAPGASGFIAFSCSVSPVPPPSGLIVNRVSATQLWDSVVALSNPTTGTTGARLVASATAGPPLVHVGDSFLVTLTLTNVGCADAVTPAVSGPIPYPAGAAVMVAGPTPAVPGSIAVGASVTLTWTMTAATPGDVYLNLTATAVDGTTGSALVAGPVSTGTVHVATPAALAASLVLTPGLPGIGDAVTAILQVRNTGGLPAEVTGLVASASAPAVLGALAGPAPAVPVTIDPGGSASFTWIATAGSCGTSAATATVTGVEAGTGNAVPAALAVASPISVHGPPASLSLSAVPPFAPAGTAVELVAALTDSCGVPVPGFVLAFSLSNGGGAVSPFSATTDQGGLARTTLTLGPEVGPVVARVDLAVPPLWAEALVQATLNQFALKSPGAALSANVFAPIAGQPLLVRLLVASPDPVVVNIYTASGRLVRTLRCYHPSVNEQFSIPWNGRTDDGSVAARGVYVVRISGGGIEETLKLVVR